MAHAADGDLDQTFGTNGIARSGVDDAGADAAIVVQSDGKILTCGSRGFLTDSFNDFFISRFLANGALDTAFGIAGHVTIDFDHALDYCTAIKVQSDGRIVAAGRHDIMDPFGGSTGSFALTRVNSDGALDTTFGGGTGKVTVTFDSGSSSSTALALQRDGKIIVAGEANVSRIPFKTDFAVLRLLPNGSLDFGFGVAGKATAGFGAYSTYDRARSIALDDQGRILLAGGADILNVRRMGIVRLLTDGALDTTFGDAGHVLATADIVNKAEANQVIVQHDGTIVLAGQLGDTASATPHTDMAVVRLLPDGTPDATFANQGLALIPVDLGTQNGVLASANDVVEQGDHRLVLAGIARINQNDYWKAVVVRLDTSGTPDPSFAGGGTAIFDSSDAQLFVAVTLSDGRILAAGAAIGYGASGTTVDTIVTRLQADAIFAHGFE
ncbi:MAG: hypothetical protein ABIO49_08760 [Dokdonella sp.]